MLRVMICGLIGGLVFFAWLTYSAQPIQEIFKNIESCSVKMNRNMKRTVTTEVQGLEFARALASLQADTGLSFATGTLTVDELKTRLSSSSKDKSLEVALNAVLKDLADAWGASFTYHCTCCGDDFSFHRKEPKTVVGSGSAR